VPVSGPMAQEKALGILREIDYDSFKAFNSWYFKE